MSALAVPVLLGLMQQCVPGQAPSTLMAIIETESGRDPLKALDNDTRTSLRFTNVDDAIRRAYVLISDGHSVDLGLMQINSRNLGWLGLSVADAFDACQSLRAGVKVLQAGYDGGETHAAQQAALGRAISRYNTGDAFRGFANGYVQRVQASAALMIPAIDAVPLPQDTASSEDVARPVPRPRNDALQDGLHPSAMPQTMADEGLVDGAHPRKRK